MNDLGPKLNLAKRKQITKYISQNINICGYMKVFSCGMKNKSIF